MAQIATKPKLRLEPYTSAGRARRLVTTLANGGRSVARWLRTGDHGAQRTLAIVNDHGPHERSEGGSWGAA